jgi:hypothetical protein
MRFALCPVSDGRTEKLTSGHGRGSEGYWRANGRDDKLTSKVSEAYP